MAKEESKTSDDSRPELTPELPGGTSGDTPHGQGETRHAEVRYERLDVGFRAVALVIVFAIICGCADLYLVWRVYHEREQGLRERNVSRYPLALDREPALPIEPRLEQLDRPQGDESPELRRREPSKEDLLASYGPTSDEGYVHVPIERAMELVVGELPSRRQSPAAGKDNGLVDAGESNSGRMFRGAPR